MVTRQISVTVICIQLQRLIRVLFTSNQLSDASQSKFLETEGISGILSVEGSRIHHAHNNHVGNSVLERVVDLKCGQSICQGEGSYLASHQRACCYFVFISYCSRQTPVNAFVESQLT